jgi:hypothetical protein
MQPKLLGQRHLSSRGTLFRPVRARIEFPGPLLDDRIGDCHHVGIEIAVSAVELRFPNLASAARRAKSGREFRRPYLSLDLSRGRARRRVLCFLLLLKNRYLTKAAAARSRTMMTSTPSRPMPNSFRRPSSDPSWSPHSAGRPIGASIG